MGYTRSRFFLEAPLIAVALLLVFWVTPSASHAQPMSDNQLIDQLIDAIGRGHAKLRANVQNATGVRTRFVRKNAADFNMEDNGVVTREMEDLLSTTGMQPQPSQAFARTPDSIRIEVSPQSSEYGDLPMRYFEPAALVQGDSPSDRYTESTAIAIESPRELFTFEQLPAHTKQPVTVFIYKDRKKAALRMVVDSVRRELESLTNVGGASVRDMIRKPDVKFEQMSVDGRPVVRITYSQLDPREPSFEILLDPAQEYAVLNYRIQYNLLRSSLPPMTVLMLGAVRSQKLPGGQIVPQAIGAYGSNRQDRLPPNVQDTVTQFRFDSLDPPQPGLFDLATAAGSDAKLDVQYIEGSGLPDPPTLSLWERGRNYLAAHPNIRELFSMRTLVSVIVFFCIIGLIVWTRIREIKQRSKAGI